MTYTFTGLGKNKKLAKTLLQIELSGRKIKSYPSYSKESLRIDDFDAERVKEIIKKIKSPKKLKYEVSNY